MSTSLVPILQRELQIFDEDPNKLIISLKNLKAHAKDLNPHMLQLFVAEVSEAIDASDSCEVDAILVFEMLARLHGRKIVPNIGNIMSAISRTFSSGIESFESCSKVVSAIALYGIDPLAHDEENMKTIQSICKPLSDALMCFEGNASSGAAICLEGLVNLDVWRFASDETVNVICLKVSGALGEVPMHTNFHVGLVMALAKHNTWVLEAYVRSIIRSGLKILSKCLEDDDTSHSCFSVIGMINFLMRCVDARSFISEIETIIEFMERCLNDQSPCVQEAAFEALQTAKMIAASPRRLGNKLDSNPITGSKLASQSILYDNIVCSALSSEQSSCNIQGVRHTDMRMWNTDVDGDGGVEKDGLFGRHAGLYGNTSMVYFEHCRNSELNEGVQGCRTSIQSSNFNSTNLFAESACTNSKRSCSIGDVRMTSTSRRIIPSPHSCSNSAVISLDRPDFRRLRSSSSKDEAYMPPNEIGHCNALHRRANFDSLMMRKEKKIQGVPSYGSKDLASNYAQTCVSTGIRDGKSKQTLKLRKFSVSKVVFGQICVVSMIFLVIMLLVVLNSSHDVLFNVFPT